MALTMKTIPGVELAKTGTWNGSAGTFELTEHDFDEAIAAIENGEVRRPIVKLGHKGGVLTSDDAPAIGRLINVRKETDGEGNATLLADMQVPSGVYDVLPVAYPSRSIEGFKNFRFDPASPVRSFALTGLALLGDTPPAIQNLNDLSPIFEARGDMVFASNGAEVVSATIDSEIHLNRAVSAAVQLPGDVRDQFADNLAIHNPGSYAFVYEVWSEDGQNFAIVSSDDGEFYRIPWAEEGDSGLITFGEPVRVHSAWVTDPDSALDDMAEGYTPASPFMLSSGATPLHIAPDAAQSVSMSTTTDTEAVEVTDVDLTEDTSVDTTETTETVSTTDAVEEVVADEVVSDEDADVVEFAAAAAQVAVLASQLPAGFQIIASSNLAALENAAVELAAAKEQARVDAREAFLSHACEVEGRFAPSQIESLRVLFDANEGACRAFVSKCAVGTLPTTVLGSAKESDATISVEETVRRFKAAK